MPLLQGADVVRLPGGRVMTRARARAMGLVDADGNTTAKGMALATVPDRRNQRQAERDAKWRADQDLDAEGGPLTTEDGKIKGRRKAPKPLVPRNVDHDGNVIEDPEVLAKIAADTAAIEAAKAKEAEAAGAD